MSAGAMALLGKAASDRAIRAHLGERLRTYYDCMGHIPPPDRLAELIDRLTRQTDEQNNLSK